MKRVNEEKDEILFPPPLGEGQGGRPVHPHKNGKRYYAKTTLQNSRRLRKNLTDAEKKLWQHLRGKQFSGWKFRRQYVIGKYIADFVYLPARLIIELDGGQHAGQTDYDNDRSRYLQLMVYKVLRIWNHVLLMQTDAALQHIHNALHNATPTPTLPQRGREYQISGGNA